MTTRRPIRTSEEEDRFEQETQRQEVLPPPPPFSCYLNGQILGFEPTKIYLNFFRPKYSSTEAEGTGRLTISIVHSLIAIAERPIHVEWLTHANAVFLVGRAIESGWRFEPKSGLANPVHGTPGPHRQIDPDTFLAVLVRGWIEKNSQDPRFANLGPKPHAHPLAS